MRMLLPYIFYWLAWKLCGSQSITPCRNSIKCSRSDSDTTEYFERTEKYLYSIDSVSCSKNQYSVMVDYPDNDDTYFDFFNIEVLCNNSDQVPIKIADNNDEDYYDDQFILLGSAYSVRREIINVSENVHCKFTGCLRVNSKNHNFCYIPVESVQECEIKVSTEPTVAPSSSSSGETLSISSSYEEESTTISYGKNITSVLLTLTQQEVTTSSLSKPPKSISISPIYSITSVTQISPIYSTSNNSPVSSYKTVSSTSTNIPGSSSVLDSSDPLIVTFVGISISLFGMVITVLTCLFFLARRNRTCQKTTSSSPHIECSLKTSFINDDANVRFQAFDRISVTGSVLSTTESVVTIVQSLEVNLSCSEPHNTIPMDDHSTLSGSYMKIETEPTGVTVHEGNKQSTTAISESTLLDKTAVYAKETVVFTSEEEEEEDQNFSDEISGSKNSDAMSYVSCYDHGYVITSSNKHEEEEDCSLSLQEPINSIQRCQSMQSSCSSSQELDADSEADPHSDRQFSMNSDGHLRPITSEGSETNEERTDYVEIPDTHSFSHHRHQESLDYTEFYPSKEISMLHNASVNDYVFQKKINNRLAYAAVPSSSGYSSGHTALTSSYLQESDDGYMDSTGFSEFDCDMINNKEDGYTSHADNERIPTTNLSTFCNISLEHDSSFKPQLLKIHETKQRHKSD